MFCNSELYAKSTHHPHEIDDQYRECKTGGGAYFPSFLQFVKVAGLQSEFFTKDFFRATNFLTKNAPKFPPNF